MNNRFPVLSTISTLLKVIGWLVVIAGILYIAYGMLEPNQPGHFFGIEDMFELLSGLGFALIGLFVIAISEIIGVLFAIEENTRMSRASVSPALPDAPEQK